MPTRGLSPSSRCVYFSRFGLVLFLATFFVRARLGSIAGHFPPLDSQSPARRAHPRSFSRRMQLLSALDTVYLTDHLRRPITNTTSTTSKRKKVSAATGRGEGVGYGTGTTYAGAGMGTGTGYAAEEYDESEGEEEEYWDEEVGEYVYRERVKVRFSESAAPASHFGEAFLPRVLRAVETAVFVTRER